MIAGQQNTPSYGRIHWDGTDEAKADIIKHNDPNGVMVWAVNDDGALNGNLSGPVPLMGFHVPKDWWVVSREFWGDDSGAWFFPSTNGVGMPKVMTDAEHTARFGGEG